MIYSEYLRQVKTSKQWPALAGSTPQFPSGFEHLLEVSSSPQESRGDESREQILEILRNQLSYPHCELTMGASQALFQVLWYLRNQGYQHLTIERPYYEPYFKLAQQLGFHVDFLDIHIGEEVDYQRSARGRQKSRILLVSNPHFFFGTRLNSAWWKKLVADYEHVVLDEVFSAQFSEDNSYQSDFSGSKIIRINSLSKSMGLSFIRFGWIAAGKKIIEDLRKQSLFLHVDIPTHSQRVAVSVLQQRNEILNAMKRGQGENRELVRELAGAHSGLLSHDFSTGHFGAIRLPARKAKGLPILGAAIFGGKDWYRFRIDGDRAVFREFVDAVES